MIIRNNCTIVIEQARSKNKHAKFCFFRYMPLLPNECFIEQLSHIKNTFNKCKMCVGYGVDIDKHPCNMCDEFSSYCPSEDNLN